MKRIKQFSIVFASVALLSSCFDNSPVVTKTRTVEEYNATIECADDVLNELGYDGTGSPLASTGYSYVLFDSHRKCGVGTDGQGFRTVKDSRNDEIDEYDICIYCEKEWSDHQKR